MKIQKQILGKNDITILRSLNIKAILFTILMLILTSLVNGQTFKVTGGINLMSVNTAFESSNGGLPTDPNDGTDLSTRMAFENFRNTNQSLSTTEDTTNEIGFYLGLALIDLTLFNNFKLQPEVRFVLVKDFNQIQVPVLLKYGVSEKIHVSAGPNLALLLDTGDGVKSFNFALDFGVSYNVSDKIALDARYDWGLTNLLENGDNNNYLKINNIQFGVVYHFGKI